MNRPASPNTSANKHLPRNPPGSKIQKWATDKQSCVLTLLRSGGEVKIISREQALGLSLEDLQCDNSNFRLALCNAMCICELNYMVD
ncbi:hypothetical protein Hanom_Chr07g00620581 [Helianthus anomalus]